VKLDNYDSQFLLFCKNHYHAPVVMDHAGIVKGLRALVAWRAAVPTSSVSDRDLVTVLLVVIDNLNLREEVFRELCDVIVAPIFYRGRSTLELFCAAFQKIVADMVIFDNGKQVVIYLPKYQEAEQRVKEAFL
jgi:hypothetical protein